ncbi:MAG: serine hydrolase [Clostridia bacterium]|nr:serine hydrolase [Clostridia bacterium]
MENYKRKAVELVSNLALEYKPYPAVVPYEPAKDKIMWEDRHRLLRSTPERHGIPSSLITELFSRLEAEGRANVHSIVITKDSEVIAEAARPGFSPNLPHLSHSMSKTVTGMLILMLADDGKIDTGAKAISFFPEITTTTDEAREVSVEHLLTMSSGLSFSEAGTVTETEWTRAFFESESNFTPGEKFAYNSMNSYVLMRIADAVSREHYGLSAEEFLRKRLFSPLGIENAFWEYGPEGVLKGGWGLYMSAESWARLGIMMMNYGVWHGKRIISEHSVINAISTQSITGEEVGDFNYGYQLWVSRKGDDFLFNGMLGQNVWVCPKNGIVVALNSGNNELFQKSPALEIIKSTLGGELPRYAVRQRAEMKALSEKSKQFFTSRQWIIPHAPLRGLPYVLGIKNRTPFNSAFDALLGEYLFPQNNQGILPVFIRVMQNNYQGGIRSFVFRKNGNYLRLCSFEGKERIDIDFGFYSQVRNIVSFGGERYIINAIADAVEEADGEVVYKLELIFPELPNTRRIILSLAEDGRLTVKMREIPDERITDSFISAIPSMSGKYGLLMSFLERNLGQNFIKNKLAELFSPEFLAVREGAEDAERYLEEENERISGKIESSKLIRTLIYKFVVPDADSNKKGGISGIISKFLPK